MNEIDGLSSAALFDLLCEERSVVGPLEERDEARALEVQAREHLLARADAGRALAGALPEQAAPLAPLALHRHRVRCRVARELLAALPVQRAMEGLAPTITSAAPDVAEAAGLALLEHAARGEASLALLLVPGAAPVPRRRALLAVAEQRPTAEVIELILELARGDVDRDLCLKALDAAGAVGASHLAALARGDDATLSGAALDQLQAMREAGTDGGLALPLARALLPRGGAGWPLARALCRVLVDDDLRDLAFACGDSGRCFDAPLALVDGLRRWLALAERPSAGGQALASVGRFDDRTFTLSVPLPGGDLGLRPVLGEVLPSGADGAVRFYRAPVQALRAGGHTLYDYRFGTWIEGADPHELMLRERLSQGADPIGLAGLAPPGALSAAWLEAVAARLHGLRAGRYLGALIEVTPVLHQAEGPRPFWEPTRSLWGDEDDEHDEEERDAPEEAEVASPFGAAFHVAAAADVAVAFLPVMAGEPGDDGDLCVAYAWPRPEPGELHPSHPVPQGIRLHAAVLAGEGALVRASRGGPPALVLCIAPHAVPGDDVRLARAFAALGAWPLGPIASPPLW